MSEEQGNSIKRLYKAWPTILYLSFLLCIIGFVIFISVGQKYEKESPQKPYSVDQWDIQNVVQYYESMNNGSLPLLDGTYTNINCSNCHVLNVSALLQANGGLLHKAPDSCKLSVSGNDNCGGNASLGCSTDASYIWIVDTDGNVFSYCAGAGCTTNNSGYQDVWP